MVMTSRRDGIGERSWGWNECDRVSRRRRSSSRRRARSIHALSAAGSVLVFDDYRHTADSLSAMSERAEDFGIDVAPLIANPDGTDGAMLAARGWSASERSLPELLDGYQRKLDEPLVAERQTTARYVVARLLVPGATG
jgi:hypothetical protein